MITTGASDEHEVEEQELKLLREESNRLLEANEQWFADYQKEFRKTVDQRAKSPSPSA